jgi:hypothetical protein
MWDAFTDKESGRVYYQNHQTQEVTWEKPANMAIVEMVTKPPAEPTGVTVGVDASSPKLKSSRGNVLSGKLACLCCVVFLGLAIVVILVLLFAVGYGHFTPPCVGIESIQVGAIDIDFLSVLSGSPKGNHQQDFPVLCEYILWRRSLTTTTTPFFFFTTTNQEPLGSTSLFN